MRRERWRRSDLTDRKEKSGGKENEGIRSGSNWRDWAATGFRPRVCTSRGGRNDEFRPWSESTPEIRDRRAVVNAFDSGAVNAAIGRVRPDAVIEELTSLPRDYTPEAMRAAEERDRKVRLEGGQNVYHAARTAGARRYLVQSTGFFYGPGALLASETDLLAGNASPGVSGSVRTYLQIEKRVLGSRDLEGVASRYGFFYGPGTHHDPGTGGVARQVREQKYPVIGSGTGVYSFIHVEDAAAATVAALESDQVAVEGNYGVWRRSDISRLNQRYYPVSASQTRQRPAGRRESDSPFLVLFFLIN